MQSLLQARAMPALGFPNCLFNINMLQYDSQIPLRDRKEGSFHPRNTQPTPLKMKRWLSQQAQGFPPRVVGTTRCINPVTPMFHLD
jgi:hypothetical protein